MHWRLCCLHRLAEEGKQGKEKVTLPTKTLDGQLVYDRPRTEGVDTLACCSCAQARGLCTYKA